MLTGRAAGWLGILLLVSCSEGQGQDFLGLFIPGDPEYRLIGGNPPGFEASTPDRPVLRYDYRIDNYYREKRQNGTEPGFAGEYQGFRFSLPFASGSQLDITALRTTILSTAFNSPGQQADYRSDRKSLRMSYKMPVTSFLDWNILLGGSNATSRMVADAGTGFTFRNSPARVSFHLEQSSQARELGIGVNGVQGILPVEFRDLGATLSAAYVHDDMHISITGSHTIVSRLAATHRKDNLRLEPAGTILGFSSSMHATISTSWKAGILASVSSFRGEALFTARGSRYAMIQGIGFDEAKIVGGIMKSDGSGSLLIVDAGWQRLVGFFEGYAESWPFISFFESPVPSRGNIRLGGRFEFHRIRTGIMAPLISWLEVGGSVTVTRIRPSLRVESWQPGFLGIGQKGYQDRRLSVTRIDGVLLSSGFRVLVDQIGIRYAVTQFVPINIKRTVPEGSGSLIAAPARGEILESGGGLFQYLGIELRL